MAGIIFVAVIGLVGWRLFRARQEATKTTLLRQARVAALRGDIESATLLCQRLLKAAPNHPEALELLGGLTAAGGDHSTALGLFRQIGDDPPSRGAAARYQEALALLALGRAVEAEAALRRAIDLAPTATPPVTKLRELYTLQLRRDALRHLLRNRRALQLWSLADLLDFIVAGDVPPFMLGNWIERLRAFADGDDTDVHSRLALAECFLRLGKNEACVETARDLVARDRRHSHAVALLAEALLQRGSVDQARREIEQSASDNLQHPRLACAMGRLALVEGRWNEAVEYLEFSLDQEPGDPVALHCLGQALNRLGRTQEASGRLTIARKMTGLLETAQRMLKKTAGDQNPRPVLHELADLGRSLLAAGRAEDALYCAEFAMQNGLESDDLPRLIAEADSARSRFLEARRTQRRLPIEPRNEPPQRDLATRPVQARPQPTLRFDQAAATLGLSFAYFSGQTGKKYLFEQMGGGVAAFDYDNDGWTDVYFTQGSRFPRDRTDEQYRDQLFRNQSGAVAVYVTAAAGLGDPDYSLGCAASDYDNDGFVDLFVANFGPNRAYRNNGDGTFADVTLEAGVAAPEMSTSLALADFDGDGDLDLYVVNYVAGIDVCRDQHGRVWVCLPTVFDAEQDVLYENRGDGTFVDVSAASGIRVEDGKGLGVIAANLDDDALPEIYVANDTTPNFLFHNVSVQPNATSGPKLRFEECGLLAGAAVDRNGRAQAGMGIACADFDDNGRLDLYVTNFYAETNTLYLNQGRLLFVDSLEPKSLVADTNPLLGFGAQPLDADLDGRPDLFVANGHIDDYRPLMPEVMWKMPARIYQNHGGLRFTDASESAGAFFSSAHLGRGVARLDWNRDGRPDLVVVHQDEPAELLVNATKMPHGRLVVEFIGTRSARDAVNTRFWVVTGEGKRRHEIVGGGGYLSENERRQMIGLGSSDRADIEIHWPSGCRERSDRLPAESNVLFVEGRHPHVVRYHPVAR